MNEPQIFYVYALFDANGIPRYIGKGKGSRWFNHQRWIERRNQVKRAFIKRTLGKLGDIPKVKVRQNISEAEAFETEIALIKAIGRQDKGLGPLTNMSDGGTGGYCGNPLSRKVRTWTPEQRKHFGEKIKSWWASASSQEKELQRSVALKMHNHPNYGLKRRMAIVIGKQKRSPEQRAMTAAKLLVAFPPEKRSEAAKRFHSSQTQEERNRRVIGSLTQDQRRERSIKSNKSQTTEQRSARNRLAAANFSPEAKIRRKERARLLGMSRWITNGQDTMRISEIEAIPVGWRYGRTRV
jgi:hypothetical protein